MNLFFSLCLSYSYPFIFLQTWEKCMPTIKPFLVCEQRSVCTWNFLNKRNLCSYYIIKNMWIKELCSHKVWDFPIIMAYCVWKLFAAFEKLVPVLSIFVILAHPQWGSWCRASKCFYHPISAGPSDGKYSWTKKANWYKTLCVAYHFLV